MAKNARYYHDFFLLTKFWVVYLLLFFFCYFFDFFGIGFLILLLFYVGGIGVLLNLGFLLKSYNNSEKQKK